MASLQTPLKALARRAFSSRWKLQRDSDMYANRAIREGLRSRAAYKLEEINNRFGFFLRPVSNPPLPSLLCSFIHFVLIPISLSLTVMCEGGLRR